MPHPRSHLREGEEVVLDLRPHWWQVARQTAVLLVAVVVGVGVLLAGWHDALELAAGAAILVALGYAAVHYARWASTRLVLTTDRLIYRSGVLTRSGIEIPLERINTVFFRQSLLERLLRSGDLVVESAGEQGRQDFANTRRPVNVQNEIYRQVERGEDRRRGRLVGAAAGHSIPEQIAQLDELRQRGVLTEAEFQQKKADLLRRL